MSRLIYLLQVYEGYADDPRNTDNAWLETTVCNYHDNEGKILKHVDLRVSYSNITHTCGVDLRVSYSNNTQMCGSQSELLK